MMEQNYLREIQVKLDKNLPKLRADDQSCSFADDAKNKIRYESIDAITRRYYVRYINQTYDRTGIL